MNDAEISYALAKAIGWPNVYFGSINASVAEKIGPRGSMLEWRTFDYRDRTVWGGLVEGYEISLTRQRCSAHWFAWTHKSLSDPNLPTHRTPAKAIALLVIELAKRGKLPERRA